MSERINFSSEDGEADIPHYSEEQLQRFGRAAHRNWIGPYLNRIGRIEADAERVRGEEQRARVNRARRSESPFGAEEALRRERDREKESRHTSVDFSNEVEANAFYAQTESEGLPQKQETLPSTSEELLRDAKMTLNSHFDQFIQEGAEDSYRSGYYRANYERVLEDKIKERISQNANGTEDNIEQISPSLTAEIIKPSLEGKDESERARQAERIRQAERRALLSLVEEGAHVETDEYGQEHIKYALPEKFRSVNSRSAEKFISRYSVSEEGQTLETVLASREVTNDDPDVRRAAYRGFANIAEALSKTQDPDTSRLDRYFEYFQFGELPTSVIGLMSSLTTRGKISAETTNYINNYLKTRPEMHNYFMWMDSAEHVEEEKADLDKVSESYHLVKAQEAVEQMSEIFGISTEELTSLDYPQIDGEILSKDTLPARPSSSANNYTISEKVDAVVPVTAGDKFDAEAYSNRESKRRIPQHEEQKDEDEKETRFVRRQGKDYAAYKASGMRYLLKTIAEKVDPEATLLVSKAQNEGERKVLGDSSYMILLFQKLIESTNESGEATQEMRQYAIAESTAVDHATYTWSGQPGEWSNAFAVSKHEAQRNPGVKRQTHRSFFESIITHHKKTLTDLGLDWHKIIPEKIETIA